MMADELGGEGSRKFTELSDDQLRELAKKTDGGMRTDWTQYDRAMLLAFFSNRYRDGVVPADLSA